MTWTCVSIRPGRSVEPVDVDLLVAVEPDPDLGDQPVLDRDVGFGDGRARSVEYPSTRKYRPHLDPFQWFASEAQAYAAVALRDSLFVWSNRPCAGSKGSRRGRSSIRPTARRCRLSRRSRASTRSCGR